MTDKRIKNATYAKLPQYKEKYIIIDGKVYLNVCAKPGEICAARFLRGSTNGKDLRNS